MGEEGRSPILHVKKVKLRALAYTTYLDGIVTQFVTTFCYLALWSRKNVLHILRVRTYRPVWV